eukprot:scaffold361_cov248-Pinguiococcus_pyrenoidosus.AAC.16
MASSAFHPCLSAVVPSLGLDSERSGVSSPLPGAFVLCNKDILSISWHRNIRATRCSDDVHQTWSKDGATVWPSMAVRGDERQRMAERTPLTG